MYNEVWPAASWGSIEYGPPDQPGQLLGGRWRPLHYQLRSSVFGRLGPPLATEILLEDTDGLRRNPPRTPR